MNKTFSRLREAAVRFANGRDEDPGPPATGELGGTGTSLFGGMLREEDHNSDLESSRMYDVYDRMRRSDGQVKAALSVMKLPLLAAPWTLTPASTDPKDVEIAATLQDQLMEQMTVTWHDTLRHALMSLDFGSMPFEKVWELRDGGSPAARVAIRKLAPRMPRTISEWLVDDTGGFGGVQQTFVTNDGTVKEVTIPAEKSLVFVHEREGSNYRGVSALRAAYKHWYMKDKMYVIDAVTQEKRGLGVDVAHLNQNATATQKREAQSAMMALRAHEKNYLIEPEWLTYRVEGVGRGNTRDSLPSIEHHDTAILRAILAEFIAMGPSGGSLAMHKDKSSFYLMALAGVGGMILDTFNRYQIPQMVTFNWPGVDVYPKMEHGRLDSRDVQSLADAVSKLMGAGGITPNPDTEQDLREALELPDLSDEDRAEVLIKYGRGDKKKTISLPTQTTQGHHVRFAKIDELLDAARDRIVEAVKGIQKRQVAKLEEVAENLLAKNTVTDIDLEKIQNVSVPFKQEVGEAVFRILSELYTSGSTEVRHEMTLQGHVTSFADPLDAGDREEVLSFLRHKSMSVAFLMADRLKSTFIWELLTQIRVGGRSSAVGAALSALSDRAIQSTAGSVVSEAHNLGREQEAARNSDLIREVEYSALGDSGTCEPCSEADGETFPFGSAAHDKYRTPYQECEGKGNCRCLLVFIFEDEGRIT